MFVSLHYSHQNQFTNSPYFRPNVDNGNHTTDCECEQLEERNDVQLSAIHDLMPFIESERSNGDFGAELFAKNPDPGFMKTHTNYGRINSTSIQS